MFLLILIFFKFFFVNFRCEFLIFRKNYFEILKSNVKSRLKLVRIQYYFELLQLMVNIDCKKIYQGVIVNIYLSTFNVNAV